MDLFALAAALATALQLVVAGLSLRQWTVSECVFGTVNVVFGAGLLLYYLITWSFIHPANATGQFVNALGKHLPQYALPSASEFPDFWEDHFEGSPRWQRISSSEFYNRDLSVTARRQLTQKCLSDDLMRENFRIRFPETNFDSSWYETWDWVFYNSEGKLLGDHTPRFDWQHKQVIRRLPSPDWRASKDEYEALLDYLTAEENGDFDHPYLFLQKNNRRETMESNLKIYNEITRLLNEK